MATQTETVQYTDLNAEKFPEPVEPIKIDKWNISASTVDMKDPVVASTIGLFMIHALLRRSLRCVARQARTVEPGKRAAFVTYAKAALELLHDHHGHEEHLWFPLMQPYVDFSESSHEHEEIERLMTHGLELLKTAQAHVNARNDASAPAWPGEEISTTTERLVELLLPHLQKEETLACLYGRRAPLSVYHDFEEKIQDAVSKMMKRIGFVWSAAYQLRHFSKKEKEVFPPMPAVVRGVIGFLGWLLYGKELAFGPTEEELRN
ncbi:hypothetical protein TWF696_006556 [Orbilia brochopaga]|uniref:Hemerythrin-like domain-containing protein n=1 Tax=Orbilia brochopaga TaxID=3140254 RepID=A0AAV9UWP6_9PEZI